MASILKVDKIRGTGLDSDSFSIDGSGNITTAKTLHAPGHVVQVKYAQVTQTFTQSLTSNTSTILGSAVFTLDITPSSTSSIIKLDSHIFHEWSNQAYATEAVWFFYRDSTLLRAPTEGNRACGISMSRLTYHDDDATSTPEMVYYTYFDAPSTTSQITYKVGVRVYANSTLYVNRTVNDTNNTQAERGISFISATEIAG
tara:strand:+ start:2236 stop:2835 length:600 start_codon:yes stop_codon:yes gene_type:complete